MEAPVVRPVATPLVGVGSHRRTGEHGEKALMTLWRNLVVALVAAFALAACSSSGDNGDTSMPMPTDPGPSAYEMALEAIAAAETAAEAEAAVATAVAAGITGAQLQSLNMAVTDRVAMLDAAAAAARRAALVTAAECDDATAECVDAHDALIAALQADVDALAEDETATNAQQNAAQEALETAQATRNALQMQVTEIDRSTETGSAVGAAVDAANGLEDARDADDIANAEMLLATAKGMVTEADDYAAQIEAAEMAIARAKERNDVDAAVMAAEAAATGLASDSSVDAVTAAQARVDAANMAIADAEHLTDAEKATETAKVVAAQVPVTLAKNRNDAAAQTAKDEADQKAKEEAEAKAKADAAAGKALKAALGETPLSNLDAGTTRHDIENEELSLTVATLTPAIAIPDMEAGDSAGALGDWAGTHYAHTNAGTKVSNSAIVYTNQAEPKSYPIAERYAVDANNPLGAGSYEAATRTLNVGTAADANIKADMFPTAGEQNFAPASPSAEVQVPGTYQGASGTYRCTGTCTATAGDGGVISLSDAWVFVHVTGASVSVTDENYLFFGWWLRKDKDDEPTHASAFTGVVGAGAAILGSDATNVLPALPASGSATYTGVAAGKFASNDPLHGGDAGHFTADATLTAKFGTAATAGDNNSNGLSGMLDNFMANGEAVPWSVSLLRANFGTTIGATEPFDDPDTSSVNEATDMTVWSIDGNSAAADGTWSAQMYDEMPGNQPNGDGSNVPTSVTGTFQSHFGSTHTMVGAFGAER